MEKEKEGVIATAKDAIADTAKAGLDAAATGSRQRNEGSGCDRRHRCDGGSIVVGDQSAKGDPRKAHQEDKTQAAGKEADCPEGFCHGPKDGAKEGRRKEAGYEIDAQDGQGPQIRAGKAAGGEAQTQNCCATSIQTDEALERSLTRFLAGLGSCRVF